MLVPIKSICERKDMRRDGTSVIYIQYCYSADKRTLLNSEIAIPPAYWNKKRLCISNDLPEIYGNLQVLNSELNRMIRLAEDLIYFANCFTSATHRNPTVALRSNPWETLNKYCL